MGESGRAVSPARIKMEIPANKFFTKTDGYEMVKLRTITNPVGGPMAFAQNSSQQSAVELRPNDRLTLGLIGMGVIFASLGLGEAVYRFAFFDFDGATDRLPIEMLFGLAFARMTTKLARRIYQYRMATSARINLIRDRAGIRSGRRIVNLSMPNRPAFAQSDF
jgi:hypothetical protein